MEISIIVPIFNEEKNLLLLHERLRKVCLQLTDTFEIIFVNDCSTDGSIHLIKKLAAQFAEVKYIHLSRNFGHQIAVSAGLAHCKGNAVVIIDADLQDPPELINVMYDKWKNENYQVVYAQRNKRAGESWLKRFTAKIFYRILVLITSVKIPLDVGDFRLIDRVVVAQLNLMPEQQKFLRGQIAWIGFRQTFVRYDRLERWRGKTGYTYRKMIRLAIDGITSFSDFPLKFATLAGFVVSAIAFIMIIYAIYQRYFGDNYQAGWASLMISILFLGGIQLIGIGIIGEYISRIGNNVKQRPLYIIAESNIALENKTN